MLPSSRPETPCSVKRAIFAVTGALELVFGGLLYFWPKLAFALLGRPVVDPVIARQYGLFLGSVALMYAIASIDPIRYRQLVWVALVQRGAELVAAVIDWRAGALPSSSFALLAGVEVGIGALLWLCGSRDTSPRPTRAARARAEAWLGRALFAFGGLQVFWAVLSTIFVQLGARLLGWKLQDPYTTQQQGIALLVIGLTSLLAGSDVRCYRALIWVPVSSQALGVANAVNELRLGTISPTVALIQWTIQAAIIAGLLGLAAAEEREYAGAAGVTEAVRQRSS